MTHAPASTSREDAPALLRTRGITFGYGAGTVLQDVDLTVPASGILGIMGPAGAGKTTLLRVLAGAGNPNPAFWLRGTIERDGVHDTQAHGAPGFLAQKDRLYGGSVLEALLPSHGSSNAEQIATAQDVLEACGLWPEFKDVLHRPVLSLPLAAHKKLLLARMLAGAPCGLFIDEPLSDVAVADEDALIEFLRALGRRRAVVVILHNKQQARRLCDRVCLVSGGGIAETAAASTFFAAPASACGREFLERGSGWLSASTALSAQPVRRAPSEPLPWSSAPILAEFRWVIDALLGGAQCPGLLGNDAEDLRALRLLGVRHLVSLTEEPYDAARLAAHGIAAMHFPVIDMGVPALAPTAALCRDVAEWIERDEPVVFHCRAGLGRTGTLLACALVARGADAGSAIQRVRCANPRYIQTDAQLRFVGEFQQFLKQGSPGDNASMLDAPALVPAAVATGSLREIRPAAGPR